MMTKKDFFELYNKAVNHKVKLQSLDKKTLLQIETILKEEIKIQDKIIENLDNKLKKMHHAQ